MLMQQIQSGLQFPPPRVTVYGTEGIGKSTFASHAPKPIFIQTEDGLSEIACDKFPLARNLETVMTALSELLAQPHDYQTVVLDSLDWLERLVWDAVCQNFKVSNGDKVDGGYSKGYIHALTPWRKFLDALGALRDQKRMGVILIAHAKVEKFEDPESMAYDRYSPRLNKHAGALITEWSAAVAFANRKFITQYEDRGFGRKRNIAVGTGIRGDERILHTVGGPSCVAKNRYELPPEIPLSWPAFVAGLKSQPKTQGEPAHG